MPNLNGNQTGRIERVSWDRVRTEIEAMYEPPVAAIATLRKHRQAVGILARLAPSPDRFGVVELSQLIRELAADHQPASVNSLIGTIRTQCNYLVGQGYLARSPFSAKKSWTLRDTDPSLREGRHLSLAEVLALLDRAALEVREAGGDSAAGAEWKARRLEALIHIVLYTGARKMEALRLRVEDVDLPGRRLWIRDRDGRTKTAASRNWVPLPVAAASVLETWLPFVGGTFLIPQVTQDAPWTGGMERYRPMNQVKALGERAGVKGVTLLKLRHTWATHAEQVFGLTREQIQRILRHTSPLTQRNYIHADRENLTGLVAGHDFRLVGSDGARREVS